MEPTSEIHIYILNSSLFMFKSLDTYKEDAYTFVSHVYFYY